MAQLGGSIAAPNKGEGLRSSHAPFRALNLLSRVSGFFERRRKPFASTSTRTLREEQYRDAPDRRENSAPIPRGDPAEFSDPQEFLERSVNSPDGEERVEMAAEAFVTPIGVELESEESPIYRTFVRSRSMLPVGGIGTGAPPSVEQTAPSRMWAMPPAGGLEASQRRKREGDAPFGANSTSHEVARRLSVGEESHSPSFAPCDRERGPPRCSFLSRTHTGDAPEGLRLELQDKEAPREFSRTMALPHVEDRGPIAPVSTMVHEIARPQPRNEYRIPVQHRQASSDSFSGSSGEYPPSRPGRKSPHASSDWSSPEREREIPRSYRRSEQRSPQRGEQGAQMELMSKMLDTLARVTKAKACASKPPERFHEGQKTSISSWLEAAETYLEAKGVPLEDWPRTIETFLSEVSLVKVRRARVRNTSSSYEQYKKSLVSILGKPEDREAKRVQLDQVKQFPSEGASDFASRVLELVSKDGASLPLMLK